MKQLFYLLIFLVSAGTIGVITTNPHFVRQGAALLSLATEDVMEVRGQAPNFEDAQLARFMSDYPQSNTANTGTSVQTMSAPMAASRMPYTAPRSNTPIPMGASALAGSSDQPFAAQAAYPQQYYSAQAQYPQYPQTQYHQASSPQTQYSYPTVSDYQNSSGTPVLMASAPSVVSPQSGGVKISTIPDSEIDSAGFARSGVASTNTMPAALPNSRPIEGFAPIPAFSMTPPAAPVTPPIAQPAPPIAQPAPLATPHTPHSTLHSPPSTFPTSPVASDIHTPFGPPVPQTPSTPNPPFSTLHSPPSTPNTPHSTLHSPPSTLHPPLSSQPSTLNPPHSFSSPNVTSTNLHSATTPNVHLPEPQLQEMPIRSAIPDPSKISSQFQINPSVMVEEIPCYGAEMVARVGTKVILMGDLLPQLKRAAHKILNENLKDLSEEKLKEVTQEEKDHFIETWVEMNYPGYLQEQIMGFLVYNDFCMTKSKEEREHFEKKMHDDFDQNDIPAMIKEMGLKDKVELKECLKSRFGTSIEQERSTTVRNRLAHQWLMFAVETAEGECTHDQMMDYYSQNIKQFESKARTQWKEMVVMFSNHKSEREAWEKIVWMGNQVVAGAPFDGVAQLNSEGFTASKGGFWDWTQRGSLASQKMEETLFSLPEGKLSPIIKTEKGLHIVQVTKREEEKVTPFIEAQVVIRDRIKSQRRQKHHEAYFDDLRRKYPTIVVRDKIDFNTRLGSVDTPPRRIY